MQPLPSGWWLSIFVYLLREPPFCFLRRGVVFFWSITFLRKIYAALSRTIPFTISRKTSRNVSMIITSFPKTERRETTNHPHNIQLLPYIITIFQIYNLSIFDKIQEMAGIQNTNYADFLLSSLFASFSCCFRKMVAMIGPEMLCHTLKMALGTAASGLK
jgi:hypothetical protein